MKKITFVLGFFLLLFSFTAIAQEKINKVGRAGMLSEPIFVPSITDQKASGTIIYPDNIQKLGRAKGIGTPNIVPGKGSTGNDQLLENQTRAQNIMTQSRAPITTFVGDVSTTTPSDPTGAAGPNHYLAAWNTSFRVFNKDGSPATDEMDLSTLFPGNSTGDPIVFFDANVDNGVGVPRGRYVVTEFRRVNADDPIPDPGGFGFDVAISAGPDPVNDGWYVYAAQFNAGVFPDYTKFAVYGDSYVVTANIQSTSEQVFLLERNPMLVNEAAQFAAFGLPGIVRNGFYSPHGFHTTGDEVVPPGTPVPVVYLQDDAWGGVDDDHLKIWEVTIDWEDVDNASIELAQEITTTDFVSTFDGGLFSNIPQNNGGPDVDALQATMMNQVQYKRFGTHNSVVMNFVVDVLDPGEKAGIRWYELRQDGDGEDWSIYQEGTYSVAGARSVFQGSIVMDSSGNIALGYVSSSEEDPIKMQYTGRFDGDPLGVMTVLEQDLFQSSAGSPSDRFADYTHLSLDPVDDSFWFIAEQFDPSRRDIVSNFTLQDAIPNDIGVIRIITPIEDEIFTNNENVTVVIRNYGSNAVTNPSVQYSIDGANPIIETFMGTIEPGGSEEFTFAQRADLSQEDITYVIVVSTGLTNDSNVNNDFRTSIVTNIFGQLCIPRTTEGCNIDGVKRFVLGDIDADDGGDGCNTEPGGGSLGYSDRTNLTTELLRVDGENVHIVQAQQNWTEGPGVSRFSLWIDFDDSDSFEESEQLVEGEFFQLVAQLEDFTITLPLDANLGSHTLRVKGIDASSEGDINDPCADSEFGEVQDYTVSIVDVLAVEDNLLDDGNLSIISVDNNNFDITLNTDFEGRIAISVFNLQGQRLAHNNLREENGRYVYNLDMSYVSSGVYIVQFTDIDGNSKKTEKIIVE